MKVIEKSKIDIKFHFGRHETAGDARKIAPHFQSFKPHIFIKENAGILEPLRKDQVSNYNAWIQLIRKDPSKKEPFLAHVAQTQSLQGNSSSNWGDFFRTVLECTIGAYRCSLHFAEGYSETEMKTLLASDEKFRGSSGAFYDALLGKNPASSPRVYESSMREFCKDHMSLRDERTAEGISRLPLEIPELFPALAGAPKIRVLVAYGAAHRNVASLVAERGFAVSTRQIISDSYTQLFVKLARDPNEQITEKELAASMFYSFHCISLRLKGIQNGASEMSLEADRLFESVGTEKFMETLFAAAKKVSKMDDLMREISWMFTPSG